MKRAIVLLSGGLDSCVCSALASRQGYEVWTLSFDYGQRHRIELSSAANVAAAMGIPQDRRRLVDVGRIFAGSALTGDAEVPLDRPVEAMSEGIPDTYVPARNLVFLSLATAMAEPLGAGDLFIGVNALDYSGYPDCRPEFIEAFVRAARVGTRDGIAVHAPLQHLNKGDIVRLGVEVGAPFALTWSCYGGRRPACGRCDACQLRLKGFAEAGVQDPIPYAVPTV